MTRDIPFPVHSAAEARAQGYSVGLAAAEAGWTERGLKTWIRRFPRQWFRLLNAARRETRRAACDEAVSVLRRTLRDEHAKDKLHAADSLTSRFAEPTAKVEAKSEESNPFRDWEDGIVTPETLHAHAHMLACEHEIREQERIAREKREAANAAAADSQPSESV